MNSRVLHNLCFIVATPGPILLLTVSNRWKIQVHYDPLVFSLQSAKVYSPQILDQLVGDDTTEIPDDIILTLLNLMKAYTKDKAETCVGYCTPAVSLVLDSQPTDPKNRIPVNKNCILINHITNHWVTSYYKRSMGQLILYDSLKSKNHFEETKTQILCV